jgi:CDP-glycerol glycerophosphotransferase (TagB/SpsB family)
MVAALIEIARGPREPAVVVKLHPAEHPELWRKELVAAGAENITLLTGDPIHHVLVASDVVITSFSSAGLEALMLGVPLIVLTDAERASEMKYVERGAAVPASIATLPRAVAEVIADASVRAGVARSAAAFVRDYAGELDGRASERVLDVIREVAAGAPGRGAGLSR